MKLSVILTLLIVLVGCGGSSIPSTEPAQHGVVSLNAGDWQIFHSSGTPSNPTPDGSGWYVDFPATPGHLNYVEVPYRTTAVPHTIRVTYKIEMSADAIPYSVDTAGSPCRDHNPCTPVAEFHVFMEVPGDDLSTELGRWWYKPGFRITNLSNDSYDADPWVADGQIHTATIPLDYSLWTSVTGKGSASDFAAFLNGGIGWVGMTFGGSDFFGHGVAVQSGSVRFIMIDYEVQ